jgi:putative Ca2+/H+ antiporter (TMEM165/GDT1 family)
MDALFSDAFIASVSAVAIAEIGDKTQLLSLFLAARFRQHLAIVAGILCATLLNHALSAWLGAWLSDLIPPGMGPYLLGGSFIAVGLWLLIPDKDDSAESTWLGYGAFVASLLLFFVAEIGDKTQIATVILAATYEETLWVIVGTTVGMLLANVPVVYAGQWIMQRMPLAYARYAACALFIGLGISTLLV